MKNLEGAVLPQGRVQTAALSSWQRQRGTSHFPHLRRGALPGKEDLDFCLLLRLSSCFRYGKHCFNELQFLPLEVS